MQVSHSGLCRNGEELLAHQQPELGHLGRHQNHEDQDGQDEGQRDHRGVEEQLRCRKTLLLKQGHRVGEVFLEGLLVNRYSYQSGNVLKRDGKSVEILPGIKETSL